MSEPSVDQAARSTWSLRPRPGASAGRRRVWEVLGVIGLGIIVGEIGLTLGSLELRWIVYTFAAVVVVGVMAVVRDRERLLTTVFLLSMQIDVYIRLLYGRAGTPGLEMPLSFCVGVALFAQIYWGTHAANTQWVWFGRLERPILAMLATSAVALVFTSERFAGVARMLFEFQLVLVYALAMNLVLRHRGVDRAMKLLALTLGVQATICLIQSRLGVNFSLTGDVDELGAVPRPGGTVSTNPAGFASFIMPILMVVSARFVSRDREHRSRTDGILALLGVSAIVLTFTRAAWAGLFLGLAYITVVGIRRRYITMRQLTVLGVAAAVIMTFGIPLMQARLQEAPLGESYDERARLMQIAIGIIEEHPVFGVGPGAYNYLFKEFLGDFDTDENWVAGVHNEYLMRAAETGIVGGLTFIWLLLAALSQARRLSRSPNGSVRTFGLGWTAGLIALSWQMYWVPWRGFSYNAMLWLFLGLAEGLERLEDGTADADGRRASGAA